MPLAVNDPAAVSITVGKVGGKPRPLKVTTVVDAPASQSQTGRADPQWVWLTGSPVGPRWQESDKPAPVAGSFDIRWTEPLTKAEFDSIKLLGADGKPLPAGREDAGPPLWLDAAASGWEELSRAAISVVAAIPADQREAAYLSLHTATQTPGDHWRAALLRRAIKPATPARPDFQPPALNTLALQIGDHWAGAIGRLNRADAALAQRLARRLLHVAYLPTSDTTGAWAVVWADADPHTLETLLTTPAANLPIAATSYLAGQPSHIAWVRDDAGLRDALAQTSLATIGVVSLADQALLGTVSVAGGGGPAGASEPVAFKPLLGQSFTLAASSVSPAGSGGGSWASLKLATTAVSLPVATSAVPATPPGVLIGPFSRDWTLDSFRKQLPVRVGGVAASLLPSAATPGRWELYLESRPQGGGGGGDAELERERFRVWAGPTGAPVVSISVGPDGTVTKLDGASGGDGVTAQFSRLPGGGWCAILTLPAAAQDDKGLLRLGVEHTAASGMRSSWPRPMLPWQTEPGRLAIDTAAWDRELKP